MKKRIEKNSKNIHFKNFLKKIKNFSLKRQKKIKIFLKILFLISLIYYFFFFNCGMVLANDDFSSLFGRDIRSPWRRTLTERQIDFGFILLKLFRDRYSSHLVLQALAFHKPFLRAYINNFDRNF